MQRTERHSVPDGWETYKDSQGKTRRRRRYSMVNVLMTYTRGTVHITGNYDLEMAAGFNFVLHLTDGTGVGVGPRTGTSDRSCISQE